MRPHKEAEAAANQNDAPPELALKFIAVATAMALLAGCAVTVPLRDITPSGQILAGTSEGDLACAAYAECPDGSANDDDTYRRALVGGGNANQDRTLH
jgi:hypothetical protein